MKITGHAAVFNSRSVDLGGFREIIAPGAFARTLRDGHPVFAVHHHSMADVLGSTRSGTLKLSEDSRGLHFDLALPDSSLGRDIHELVRRGDLASMSFSFFINGAAGEKWRETSSGEIERTLIDVSLVEISTVALPAYPASTVSARTATHDNQAARNRMLRRFMASRLEAA
ncbi:HK97 family phage prohead protease [Marinobacter qingdaonensis]|uniref:HK97 family phage prohead protease n=1 Tax=Marinobacter qingdaonensis TaxID=3108486 RepID=A0ABU5P1M7_9GAMM|nr:HK97 family phage prohead protease [Marinobacter sp. ASW11-75]MEA1081971.1 HK97 family phage prohead protease [Marinobacter sp. ASW11-75]